MSYNWSVCACLPVVSADAKELLPLHLPLIVETNYKTREVARPALNTAPRGCAQNPVERVIPGRSTENPFDLGFRHADLYPLEVRAVNRPWRQVKKADPAEREDIKNNGDSQNATACRVSQDSPGLSTAAESRHNQEKSGLTYEVRFPS